MNKEKNGWREVAELFHDTYERLAPKFGYETREDTKKFDESSKNGKLMIAVCKEVIEKELGQAREEEAENIKGKLEMEVFINSEEPYFEDYNYIVAYNDGIEKAIDVVSKRLSKLKVK